MADQSEIDRVLAQYGPEPQTLGGQPVRPNLPDVMPRELRSEPRGQLSALHEALSSFGQPSLDALREGYAGRQTPAQIASTFIETGPMGPLGAVRAPDFWRRVDWLDSRLPYQAERAVQDWTGGPPMARGTDYTGGYFSPRRLEDAFSANPSEEGAAVRQALEQYGRPMRDMMREAYGDTIPVYRAERYTLDPNAPPRGLLSYSTDRNVVADQFAGAPRNPRPVYSDDQIAAFERQLQQTGEVRVGNTIYRIEDSATPGQKYVMMYDSHGNEITDAYPNMPTVLRNRNAEAQEFNAARDAALARIRSFNIPVDDVVWATNRFGQQELIARPPREP